MSRRDSRRASPPLDASQIADSASFCTQIDSGGKEGERKIYGEQSDVARTTYIQNDGGGQRVEEAEFNSRRRASKMSPPPSPPQRVGCCVVKTTNRRNAAGLFLVARHLRDVTEEAPGGGQGEGGGGKGETSRRKNFTLKGASARKVSILAQRYATLAGNCRRPVVEATTGIDKNPSGGYFCAKLPAECQFRARVKRKCHVADPSGCTTAAIKV